MARTLSKRQSSFDEITFIPFVKELKGYTWAMCRGDWSAALSVAILSIPQAIAYSLVAGLSPSTGLFASIFGTIVAALFGSSSHLVLGPSSATILLVQAAASELIFRFHPSVDPSTRQEIALGLMAGMTLLIGVLQLAMSFFKLGRLIQFVSYSVVIGYLSGAVLAIIVMQLFPLFGMTCPDSLDTMYDKVSYLIRHIHQASPITLATGIISFLFVWLLKKNGFGVMSPLAMLVVMTFVVYFINTTALHGQLGSIATLNCGDITHTFDDFHFPTFDLRTFNYIIPIAFALALLGMLETNSIAKTISSYTGQRLSSNQELFALGTTNAFLSFFRALPCSGSLARSTLNIENGARTRFAACYAGSIVLIATYVTGSYVQYLPQAALSAFLLFIIPKMTDRQKMVQCFFATRSDRIVLVVTIVSCIFLSLHIAFYIGIMLSIMLYLKKAATPRFVECVYSEEKRQLRPLQSHEELENAPIRVVKVEGELFFGAVDVFHYVLRGMAEEDDTLKILILKLKHVHDLDVNFAIAIRQMYDFTKSSHKHLIIDSIPPHVAELLDRTGVSEYIGRENLFLYQSDVNSFERAYARAQAILAKDHM